MGRKRWRSSGIRFKQAQLRPADQLSEVAIEAHQVRTRMDRRSGHPGIRHRVSLEWATSPAARACTKRSSGICADGWVRGPGWCHRLCHQEPETPAPLKPAASPWRRCRTLRDVPRPRRAPSRCAVRAPPERRAARGTATDADGSQEGERPGQAGRGVGVDAGVNDCIHVRLQSSTADERF